MYHIQLMTTRKCNRNCYYCTTYADYGDEVDIDFLKYVLDCLPEESAVDLTGGEIGLLKNLDDVYRTVKNCKKIKKILVLSNGLVRVRGVDWLDEVEYWEHLISDVEGKKIKKFYDLDLKQKHRYVIVTTEITTKSLVENWNFFKKKGLFEPNFFYKLMNHKSEGEINSYFDDLCTLYMRLKDIYFQRMLIHYYGIREFNFSPYHERKELCSRYSPNLYVDLQTKEIGHCAMNLELTNKIEFNKENLYIMMNGNFHDTCCDKCYSFDNGKNRSMLNNRSYIQ